MRLGLSQALRDELEELAELGRTHMRPMGIAADRAHEPVPRDHPFFALMWRRSLERLKAPPAVDAGGRPADARRGLVLAEEMSYWDRGVCVALPGLGLAGPPLLGMGTSEQKKRFLAPFADPDRPRWAAFAMTEPGAGSDVAAISTRAVKDGSEWVLDGAKAFCSNGGRADWIVVWATVDRDLGRGGHRAFIVEAGTPGLGEIVPENKMGLIAYESSSFPLDNCRVPAGNLLGGEAHYQAQAGFRGAMKTFNKTRPAIGAMAVGINRAAFDAARDLANELYDLDRPIPRYQPIREKLARMADLVQTGRLMCWRAGHLADLEQPNVAEASMAKAYAATAGQKICEFAVDVLADTGVTEGGHVEKLYRDIKAMDIVEGTGQIQRTIIGRQLVGLPR